MSAVWKFGKEQAYRHKVKRRARWSWQGDSGRHEREGIQPGDGTVVKNTKRSTLHGFIHDNATEGSQDFTDNLTGYEGLVAFDHKSLSHSIGEYVKEKANINGVESF